MKTKKCQNCETRFGCGSDGPEPCWCMGYNVTEENLKMLREKYDNCLCEKCLIEMAQATEKKE